MRNDKREDGEREVDERHVGNLVERHVECVAVLSLLCGAQRGKVLKGKVRLSPERSR